ncbi:MAG: YhdP family phospholipid transporter [Pseudohaliea sp.]
MTRSSPFHLLAGALWRLLVAGVVLLALYVAAGRALMGNVSTLQPQLLAALNDRLPFSLSASSVRGRMEGFSPELVFTDLRLAFPGEAIEPVQLARGSLRLAPLRSLLTRSPQASFVTLSGLSVELDQDEAGHLHLRGFGVPGDDGGLRDWLASFLPRVRALVLEGNRVLLHRPAGEGRRARLDLTLKRSGSARTLDARIETAVGNQATLHAEGIGNPLSLASWRGDVFLAVEAERLERVFDWLPVSVPARATGRAGVQLWLQQAGGRSDLRLSLAGNNLLLEDGDGGWRVPLASLAMDAALVERQDGWTLHASDLSLAQGGRHWLLPRAQFDLRGDSLRVRSGEFRLDGIDSFLASLPSMPARLADALGVLAPRGQVRALELTLDDLRAPGNSWELTTRVDDLAVESWRGAPGAAGADAFVRLYPGGGDVRIDSEGLVLAFPKVYREPLAYEAVHGDLRLSWDAEQLWIRSGLLEASGEEGTARALLGLHVPFTRTAVGPAMELLVGLGDSRTRYRDKYLPYRLPGTLRRWLATAIGPGRVVTGGFAWRGSLRKRNYDHLTVQLHFDVEEATVAFDPAWPPLEDFAGRLVIDDTRVSAWGERGELGGNRLERLSAEAWRGEAGERVLAVAATLTGDAGDGLAVVKASPLAAMTGGVIEGWSAAGPVRTVLDLRIPLDDRSEPVVAVDASAEEALLRVQPGGLVFEKLSGRVGYASGSGFSSDGLAGTLWGSPVSASLSQADAGAPLALRFAGKGVPVAALFDWLQLDLPALASGEADAFGDLLLRRDQPARLTLASDLNGVALALPAPWGKTAEEPRSLAVDLRLARDRVAVDLALGDRVAGRLDLADGALSGGSLRLESDWLQGALDLGGPVPRLLLDYLDLAGLPEQTGEADFDAAYRALRPVAVAILELRRAGEGVGHLAFELDRDAGAIVARGVRGELFGLRSRSEGGGVLRWAGAEGAAGETQFAIDVAFDDLGRVLVALGYAPTLVTDNGSASADLRWTGSPRALALQALEGELAVEARDGRLLEARGSAGALKVFSLLNLAEIFRGLSLSHMFESGIPFDRAVSEFRFRRGTMEIPALTLRGAASAFEFSGVTRLAASEPSIEGELVVTLPVANNLPWVAALAGGLPVAAGVYVVSKVFEKQVKRMSSGVYEVSGPLGSPDVRLRRIFDDSASIPVDPNGVRADDPNASPGAPTAPDPNGPPDPNTVRLDQRRVPPGNAPPAAASGPG